jgi:chemotaxis protein methyltransferase CheR
MDEIIPDSEMQKLRTLLVRETGLNFPRARWPDLRRGVAATAKELGVDSPAACAARLLNGVAARKEMQSLINHLTVGETYFFREKRMFEVLESQILPPLINARRNGARHLRIWSAACCTGEEPYSIAIVLRRAIADLKDWNITLLATDINSHFLRKAVGGVFGPWSFRDAPNWLQREYFHRVGEGQFEILPEIRRMVRFARLNLADGAYPSDQIDTNDMDIIFCRNVLMYFTEPQARQVIQRLHASQSEGGWLVVGPSELPDASCSPYLALNCRGAILHQKGGELLQPHAAGVSAAAPAAEPDVQPLPPPPLVDLAARIVGGSKSAASDRAEPPAPDRLAISLADRGELSEALECCDRWIAADRLNSSGHYLRAVILQEQGATDQAAHSLRTALYVDPNCVLAHLALGNIARSRGNWDEAARHLHNARKVLRGRRPQEPMEFEGVTAGRLAQIIDSLLEMERAA